MIRSFGDTETEEIWIGVRSRGLPGNIQNKALVKLTLINRAARIEDLRNPPGNRLEKLKGDRAGQYSIRINDQWRIAFDWSEGGASNVRVIDYH